jgi:hypothetical protein
MPPINVTIPIQINQADGIDGRAGTFTKPNPHVRLKKGDSVKWRVNPANLAFQVTFQDATPLEDPAGDPVFVVVKDNSPGAPPPPPGESPSFNAVKLGSYHYRLIVSDGATIWEIANCPELDVG